MPQRAVVIGGGAIGLACAYFLNDSGWDVILVDKGGIGRGCSCGNSCLIVPSHSYPLPGPGVIKEVFSWMTHKNSPVCVSPKLDWSFLEWAWRFWRCCNKETAKRGFHAMVELGRASLDLYDSLAHTSEFRFFYQRKGLLHAYSSEEEFASAQRMQASLQRVGFHVIYLSQKETLEFEPALNSRVRGALFIEGEAHGDCFEYVQSMASGLEKRGVQIIPHRSVSRIHIEEGRIVSVGLLSSHPEPPEEEAPCDLVVLAAGIWSRALAASVGVQIPIQVAKGYSCTFDSYPGSPIVPVYLHEKRAVITPLRDRVRFGGTLEIGGHDLNLNQSRYQAVIKAGREALNDKFELRNEEAWWGPRPLTPDGLPIIDRVSTIRNLIIATGHGMLGFTQSPITGKLVAELANGQRTSLPVAPFRLDRF